MKTKMMLMCLLLCVSFVVQVQAEDKVGLLVSLYGDEIDWYSNAGARVGQVTPDESGYSCGVAEGDGSIYVSRREYSETASYLSKFSSADGTALGDMLSVTGYPGQNSLDVAYVNGHVYLADNGHGRLLAFKPDAGTEDGDPNTPSACQYAAIASGTINGIASGAPNGEPAGTVYFIVTNSDTSGYLAKWQPGTSPVTLQTFAAGTHPIDVAAYGGDVFVSLYGNYTVNKYPNSGTGTGVVFKEFYEPLGHPYGLMARSGKLFIVLRGQIYVYATSDGAYANSFAVANDPIFLTDRPGLECESVLLGNLNPTIDCKVDLADFAIMASKWLDEVAVY